MKAKNYIALGKILHNSFQIIPKDKPKELGRFTTLIVNLCNYLKTTNPKFDENRFIAGIYKKS